jgi:formylglycine-generating enzyme required for sulfatase activity
VTYATWFGAGGLLPLEAQRGRLPTEAEWEYAARGGKTGQDDDYRYAGSDSLDAVGWYWDNAGFAPHPVGGKKPNQLGIYDLSGNLWEWVQDHWHENYDGAPTDGRAWIDRTPARMTTGCCAAGRGCTTKTRPGRPTVEATCPTTATPTKGSAAPARNKQNDYMIA